jgi:hypothetical protein
MKTRLFFIILTLIVVIFGLYLFNRSYEGGVYRTCIGVKIITEVYENPTDPGKLQQSACIGIYKD